jgi:protein-disulfide isomerase
MKSSVDAPPLAVPVTERDHIQGSPAAPVTLVEYGDFECPHCGAVHPILNEVRRALGDRLRFVFRHFPLSSMHRHAMHAAEAAEAAGTQGKFWEMHDLLFEHQQNLEDGDLVGYAQSLGLDLPRFQTELASHSHLAQIQEDYRGAIRAGVKGTPAFFINGIRYKGEYDLEPFLAAVRAAAGT